MAALLLSCSVLGAAFAQEQRKAPEIKGTVWFNASGYKKISMKELRGKVILVFFWTSSDANCDTTASLLNEWYSLYKDKGLEIIGVHTPEWSLDGSTSEIFEKVDSLKMKFPIVVDEDSSIWAAYGQQMWPSYCLIDRGGYIRAQYGVFSTLANVKKMLETLLEEGIIDARVGREVRR